MRLDGHPTEGVAAGVQATPASRYADGTEDGSFGVSGQSDLSTPGDGRVDGVRDMVVDASGNITLAGESFLSGTTNAVDWLLARYCGN